MTRGSWCTSRPSGWRGLRATEDAKRAAPLAFRVELGDGAHSGPTGRFVLLHYEAEVLAWVLEQLDRGA